MLRPEFARSDFGIEFLDVQSGEVVYALNADKLFVPASTTKLLTEGTVLVAKERQTSKDALQRARRLLGGNGVNLLGCILNDLDMNKPGGYGYYQYSRYGYYAGYGAEDEKPSVTASNSS